MKCVFSAATLFMAFGSGAAQTVSAPVHCARDSQGNQVCVGTQPDTNVCGYFRFPGGGSRFNPLHCNDVVVWKTMPNGLTIYTRILGGESDEIPRQFVFDAHDNVVLFGTTYSKQFPTTPDAVQRAYGGPQPPTANYATPLPRGAIFSSQSSRRPATCSTLRS